MVGLSDNRRGQELHLALRAMPGLVARDLGVHRAGVAARRSGDREQLHSALGAVARPLLHHLRVHRAGIDHGAFRRLHLHLRDESHRLVRLGVEVRSNPLPLRHHVGVRAQDLELLLERVRRAILAHVDGRQRVNALRGSVLERHVAGLVEQDVDDHPLGGRENHLVDELLVLDVPAVAANQLHPCPRQRDLEGARVRGVRQVEADDLTEPRVQRQVSLAVDQEQLAEAPHGHIVGLRSAERCDLAVLEQDVVECQKNVAVGRCPIVRIRRLDETVAV